MSTSTSHLAALEEILRCPVTSSPVVRASADEIAHLRDRIADLQTVDGDPVDDLGSFGYLSAAGGYYFPVIDGVHHFLASTAVVLGDGLDIRGRAELSSETSAVKGFYETEGWSQASDGTYEDTNLFVDQRPQVASYVTRCHDRVQQQLSPRPGFLLDVASGPVHHPDQRGYQDGFSARLCVDISHAALVQARHNLGDGGVYVLADMTNLPFVDGSVAGAVSLHTVYHIAADDQEAALREFVRVLQPGAVGAVVYSWGPRATLTRAAFVPRAIARRLAKLAGRSESATADADAEEHPLYFHAHPRSWFMEREWDADLSVGSWQSLSPDITKTYARGPLATPFLRTFSALESRVPQLMGRVGQYPLIVFRR